MKNVIEIDLVLRDIATKQNLHFSLSKYQDTHKIAAKQEYLPKNATAKKRIKLLEKEGKINRVQHMKEDLQIFEYMRSNNLLLESEINPTKEE